MKKTTKTMRVIAIEIAIPMIRTLQTRKAMAMTTTRIILM
jgi:hypothetical protein